MNDTLVVGACLVIIVKVLAILGIYAVFVLFCARVLSSKWHPDGGKGVEQ